MRICKALFAALLVMTCLLAIAPIAFALQTDENASSANSIGSAENSKAGIEGATVDLNSLNVPNAPNALQNIPMLAVQNETSDTNQGDTNQGDAKLAEGKTALEVTLDLSGLSGVGSTVYVDGNTVIATVSGSAATFTLADNSAKSAVMYVFKNAQSADPHEIYPTNMYVWFLSCNDQGIYTAQRASAFDDILRYAGCAIRLVGEKGIRMVTSIPESARNALTGAGLDGYTLLEYGTIVGYAKDFAVDEGITLDDTVAGTTDDKLNPRAKSGKAYCAEEGKDNIFDKSNGLVQYTNVLTKFTNEQCKDDLLMRPYMKVRDASGNEITIYGGTVQRSIGYIAYQNRNSSVLTRGSNARDFVWDIVWSVYGNEYVSEYFGMEPATNIIPGTYGMASKLDMSKVAYMPGSANGTSLQLYPWRNGSNYQRFTITDNGDGTYGVSVVGTGKALAVSSASHSADVIQVEPDSTSELQKWWIFKVSGGYYMFASVAGHTMIDLTNSATGSGVNIQAATYRGSDNQCWELFDPTHAGVRVARSLQLNIIVANIIAGRDLQDCYDYVATNHSWSYYTTYPNWEYWPEEYALKLATTGSCNCYGFASLFYYCAQALGYYDMAIVSGECYAGHWTAHGWCEMYGLIYDPNAYNETGFTCYAFGNENGYYFWYRYI